MAGNRIERCGLDRCSGVGRCLFQESGGRSAALRTYIQCASLFSSSTADVKCRHRVRRVAPADYLPSRVDMTGRTMGSATKGSQSTAARHERGSHKLP